MKRRIFGLVPNVFFLGLVSLLNDLSGEMIYAVMPAFLTVVLGAPAFFVGFLEGFADALASVLKIFSGRLSDALRKRKRLVVIGYALSDFTRLLLTFVSNFWQVFVIRIFDRVGKGLRDAPRDALLAESVERAEVGKSFGYTRAMDAIGSTIGPALAIIFLPLLLHNYKGLFFIGFLFGTLAVLTFIFVRESNVASRPRAAISALPLTFSLKQFSKTFRFYLSAVFLFGLGVMPISLVLLKSQEAGLGAGAIPAMYLVYNISFVLFAIPFGRLSDRIGEKKVLLGGFFAAILAYLILANFSSLIGITLGFVVFGLYSAMTDGVHRALTSKLVSAGELAAGEGFLSASLGITSLLSGIIGGTLWTVYGPHVAFFYGIVCMVIGLFTLLRLNNMRSAI